MLKTDCKYGAKCYQQNPAHKEKYRHPGEEKVEVEKVKPEVGTAKEEVVKRKVPDSESPESSTSLPPSP